MTLDITAFRRTSEQKGLVLPENILPGRIVRFPGIGKTNGNKSGWAWLSPDGQAGAYGDWSSDIAGSWHAERSTTMTPAERTAHAKRIADVQRIQREEERRGHAEAAQRALEILTQSSPAPADHPYIVQKGIQPHGLRVDEENRLNVPVMVNGALSSLQFIDESGAKIEPAKRIPQATETMCPIKSLARQ